jgi:hypothetical protein
MEIHVKKSGVSPLAIMAIFGGLLATAASAQNTTVPTPAQEQKPIKASQAPKRKAGAQAGANDFSTIATMNLLAAMAWNRGSRLTSTNRRSAIRAMLAS